MCNQVALVDKMVGRFPVEIAISRALFAAYSKT